MTKTSKLIAGLTLVAGFGVAALPLASYADTNPKSVDVTVTVNSAAGFENPSTNGCGTQVVLSGLMPGSAPGHGFCVIKASSNSTGYTLSINTNTTNHTLGSDQNALWHTDDSNKIGAVTGTNATYTGQLVSTGGESLDVLTSAWGFNIVKGATVEATDSYFAVPSGKTTVEATSSAGANEYSLSFAATATASQTTGAYKATVLLTVE
ncbi:MAG: hypothetical protein LBQ02_01540 [Candidatus Nomurabacteria bacterium]|jgi:hypothetical protein|nr:hypothetical protein [Candidatus Nomurabacteria bacterium]